MSKINWKKILIVNCWLLIVGVLIYTRFINLGWGLPYPMHPDERNMANAVQNLKCEIPISNFQFPNKFQISNFKFQDCLNPHFFAYGQFPLYLAYGMIWGYKGILGRLGGLGLFGKLAEPISFGEAVMALRVISALASIATAMVIMGILGRLGVLGRLGKKNYMLHVSCFLIVIFSPVFIQFSHFGTTESLLILFYSLIVYYSLLFLQKKIHHSKFIILNSILCGFAIATKVSSIIFTILPIVVLLASSSRSYNRLSMLVRYIILTAITVIIFSPYNLISFGEFISSIHYESAVAFGNIRVFYTRQFNHTVPILFQITRIFPYALGWPVFVLGGLGMLGLLGVSWKKKEYNLLRFAFILVFLPNAFMYAKWTRFMAPAFPTVIIFAVLFLSSIKIIRIIKIIMVIVMIFPGLAYLSVYQNPDVRFQASDWIYKNIPENAHILSETANVVDLPLPNKSYNGYKNYNYVSFNFYDLDENPQLQTELKYHLFRADYIIVPSRRIFKNHPKEKYPLLNEYYKRLFSGELGFKKIAELTSYPGFKFQISNFKFKMEFPDEDSEETWTVFDHPVIRIYKRVTNRIL